MYVNLDNFNNIVSVFNHQVLELKNKPYLWRKIEGQYSSLSWEETKNQVRIVAKSLLDLGVLKGDRVAIISENRPEWQIADLAIMSIGAITVPAYTTSTQKDYEYILNHCEARCLIVSTETLAKKAIPAAAKSIKCKNIIMIENLNEIKNNNVSIAYWNNLIKENSNNNINLEENAKDINRKDTACIIYTSGTGGNPKGVMLSHGSMMHNCSGAQELLMNETLKLNNIRFLSWLPLSHSYEHTLQYYKMSVGGEIYYAESIDKLLQNMSEAKPHIMTAVPRFYDSLYTRISQGLKNQSKISQFLFNKTIELGKKKYINGKLSGAENFFNNLLSKIVRKKVKKRFGGNLLALVSGGAALNFEIGLYLSALGLPLLQGYGQTETGPVISANRPKKIKLDTVGPPLKNTEVKIAEDGEILVSGENMMNGYWNDPESTNNTIKDGWVHTGDIGELDNDNYLKITDRKKDIIVNAGGDNISPTRIEEKLNIKPEIAQSMLYGDFKNYLVAIIVPDKDYIKKWSEEHNKDFNISAIIKDEDFIKIIKESIDDLNKNVSVIENVRKFLLIDEEFTVENDMMTPTLKVRRFKVKEKYQEKLETLY